MREDVSAKVFQLSDLLAVGYCGSGRFGQILQHHLMDSRDDPPLMMDEHRWVVREFIPHLRDVMDTHGHLHIDKRDKTESFGPSASLLAVRGRLFTIWSDFGVDEHVLPFESIGSGSETATGSLHSLLGDSTEPIADARLLPAAEAAIEAAAKLIPSVGGTISSVKTSRYTASESAFCKSVAAGK